jgi:hypothetical protein
VDKAERIRRARGTKLTRLAICCECSGAVFYQEACSRCGGYFSIAPSGVAVIESDIAAEDLWYADYAWLRGIVRYDTEAKRIFISVRPGTIKNRAAGLMCLKTDTGVPAWAKDPTGERAETTTSATHDDAVNTARALAERIDVVSNHE